MKYFYKFVVSLPLITVCALQIHFFGCTGSYYLKKMSTQERLEYETVARYLDDSEERRYLELGDRASRIAYLNELNLYDVFLQRLAFQRLNEEKYHDLLKAFKNATHDQRQFLLSRYDQETQERMKRRELQLGWSTEQILLCLGLPEEILEPKNPRVNQQLWIFDPPASAEQNPRYLHFRNGALANWAH